MLRPLRIEYPDAWYHIMNRDGRYEAIFEDKIDYSVFLELLQETIEIFHVMMIFQRSIRKGSYLQCLGVKLF